MASSITPRSSKPKSATRRTSAGVTRVARPARELGEHDVAGHRQRVRAREAVLRTVDIWLDERTHRVDLAELHTPEQRNRIDVRGIREVVAEFPG